MRLGIASDHAGFELKGQLITWMTQTATPVHDFGAHAFDPDDDYPDFAASLGRAIATAQLDRGIAICGSGVGVCIVVNKFAGVRAALVSDPATATQGVEDDDLNVLCLGARWLSAERAREIVQAFLAARFSAAPRHHRRVGKIVNLEKQLRGA